MTRPPSNPPDPRSDNDDADDPSWDVLLSLADFTFFFLAVKERNEGRPPPKLTAPLPPPYCHQETPYTVTQGEIQWWWECASRAHTATEALITACEDLVEQNLEDPRIANLKAALARAQGSTEYWPRRDRW